MIISRVKGGLFLIGGSVIVFALDAFLTEASAMQVTMLTSIQNLLFFILLLLMVMGIYFIRIEQTLSRMWRKGPPLRSRLQILRLGF